jgi:hypothetical protein
MWWLIVAGHKEWLPSRTRLSEIRGIPDTHPGLKNAILPVEETNHVPRSNEFKPDRERLEIRYQESREAG